MRKTDVQQSRGTTIEDCPDFSADIVLPITFLTYLDEYFSVTKNRDKDGDMTLSENQADTFMYMISRSLMVVQEMQNALYGEGA